MTNAPETDADQETLEGPAYRVPIIDKMMEILSLLESQPEVEPRITEIVAQTDLPRSTVYRILNTLVHHGLIHRNAEGGYRLGLRIKGLAASVTLQLTLDDILAVIRPALKSLSEHTRQTSKFTVLDQHLAKVVAVEIGKDPFAPTSRLGSTFDLHAGAASKLLLAFATADTHKAVFDQTWIQHTTATIVDKTALQAELAGIRKAGISYDRGEWTSNVHAIAAPVSNPGGGVLGALSVTYFPRPEDAEFIAQTSEILCRIAATVSAQLARGVTAG